MKKKKIAFCVRDMRIGGVESCLIQTLNAFLRRADTELHVFTYVDVYEPIYQQYFDAHPEIIRHTLYPSKILGTKLPHFFLWRLIVHPVRSLYRWGRRRLFAMREFRDVDVAIDYYDFEFNAEFRKLTIPKIVWWHSSVNKFLDTNSVRMIQNYDKMVVLTDGFMNQVIYSYPMYKNKFVHIFNPVDIKSIRVNAKIAPRTEYKKYFVSVARLSTDKDFDTLLHAFNIFWENNNKPDCDLVIVGGGALHGSLRALADELPAAKNIHFLGSKSNPFGVMAGALANILSSYGEGLGMTLIEAAALDTLNIASDCKNGPGEVLLNGRAGILFTPGNKFELADAMDAVYNNRVDIKQMKKVATNSLVRFDSDKIADDIVRLINK